MEHKGVLCLATVEAISAAISGLEADGWKLADHFDVAVDVSEVPPDLRGQQGPVLLGQAQEQARKKAPGHLLIFVRPRAAT